MLGVDRDSAELAELFDETNGAVLAVSTEVIATPRRPGITSVSVEPAAVPATRRRRRHGREF